MNPDTQRSSSGPKVAFAYLAGTIIYGIGPNQVSEAFETMRLMMERLALGP
jgi:hypothetical protein